MFRSCAVTEMSLCYSLSLSTLSFEPTGPALGPKSGPAGLLHGLNASCWSHAELKMNKLILKGYTAGHYAGL